MGRIGEIQDIYQDGADVVIRADLGGGEIVSAIQSTPAGVDSKPRIGDFAVLSPGPGRGDWIATGHYDSIAEATENGEIRIYSRDANGELAVSIHAKNGGLEIQCSRTQPITITSAGTVAIKSPDIRLGDGAGRKIAAVGDLVQGTLYGLSTAPGVPIAPGPPTPGLGVPFTATITTGSKFAKTV